MVRAAAFASLAPALALPAAAQAPTDVLERSAPGSVHHGRSGRLDVAAVKVADELRIDGRLDEAAWSRAAILTGFSQFSPVDGLPAEDSTEMLVLYTDHAIHFGIRAFEPHGVVNATLADRDRVAGDDHVILLLDTFNDRRSAFAFLVNPLGVQGDGTYADATGTDLNPDFLFDSRGRLTDYGYEIEVRIPFKSVRYQSADVQRWGLNVVRAVQHSGQEQAWTPLDRGHPSILGQSGTLDGLTDLRRGLVLDVNPVMTARAVGAPSSAAGTAWLESFMYPADLYSSFFIERRDDTGAVLDTVPYVGTHRLPNYGGMIALNTPQFRTFSAGGEIVAGHDVNFDEWSSAWIFFATLESDWRPTDKLRVNGRYVEQRFYRTSDGSFQPAAAVERGGFRADWLFSYQPSPGTVIFAGYGTSLDGDRFFEPRSLERIQDGFFVKLSYLFRT